MATAAALREIEDDCPWLRPDFQADLAALTDSTGAASRRFAQDVRVLARLAAQVPRCPFDERGATPWTSFRRQVAVARSISDVAAAAEIRAAVRLAGPLQQTLSLLDGGRITVQRAQAFVREVEVHGDPVAAELDRQLAERVAGLPVWRIVQEVRRAAARLDPDAAARRTAEKNAGRGVSLHPDADDQASVVLFGPAVPLTRWHGTLDQRARALKQAGDPRTLDQLRFDLATSAFPCATHSPSDPTAPDAAPSAAAPARPGAAGPGTARPGAAGLRSSFVEPASDDCRRSRPVQASIAVPVETSLGLSNEPGWLDGFGWLSAPTCRLLLVDAELRRLCVQQGTGQIVDLADRDVRPPPTPAGLRQALVDMVTGELFPSSVASRTEDQHDPSPALRQLVTLRDRFCDGPTGTRTAASRCDIDHEIAYPAGPTAAWNLVARAQRTHQLKHYGWTPLRTAGSTLWFSPSGQLVEVPHHTPPPPGVDHDPSGSPPALPDPDLLHETDQHQLQPLPEDGPTPPWLPASEEPERTRWTWLHDEPAF